MPVRSCRPRRSVVTGVLSAVAVAGALALAGPVPARAAPSYPSKQEVQHARHRAVGSADAVAATRRKLTAERNRLQVLDDRAETAVEAYNGALYRLGQAKQAYAEAKAQAKQSDRAVERARKRVAALAATAYQGAGIAAYVNLFGSSDPQDVIRNAGAMSALGQQQSGALSELKAARIVRDIVRKQASAALAKQREETARVAAAKREAQARVAEQQQVIERVAVLEEKLAGQASSDRAAADNLAQERQEGIEAARRAAAEARRRAAEAARRAAARAAREAAQEAAQEVASHQHSHHSGGGGGGGSTSHSGGGSSGGGHHGHGRHAAVSFAYDQLGKWYEWAADGPVTFDCSGLTMRAWQQAGVYLPHWSVGQWYGTSRVSLNDLRKGDLVFFANDTSDPHTIHHVAIYIGGGQMIEAPHTGAQVRISSIWRYGLIGAGRP